LQNWIFDIRSRSFVLLVILFVIISMLVYFQITESFDQFVISSVADNVGNPSLDIVMQIITESGDTIWMLGFGILMLLIKKTRRIGITLMILIVLSTLLTGYIKCGMDRDRPDFMYPVSRVDKTIKIIKVIPILLVFLIKSINTPKPSIQIVSPLSVMNCMAISRVGFPTLSATKEIIN